MANGPFDCLAVVGKDPLDPFVVEQPRAIDELVEHPRGQIVGRGSRRLRMGRSLSASVMEHERFRDGSGRSRRITTTMQGASMLV